MAHKLILLLLSSSIFLSCLYSEDLRRKSRKNKSLQGGTVNHETYIPANGILKSGTFHIKQSWAEIKNYDRPVHVKVPNGDGPFPVYIALHGRGGTGARKLKNLNKMTGRIIIAPDGYDKGWSQKRPDVDFIRQIIAYIKTCNIADGSNIAIHGSSNGAGLLYRLMIELEEDTFHHGIASIGGLGTNRYDGTNFLWDPKGGNQLKTPIVPVKGRRWLQINGTEDQIVPYSGGVGTLGLEFLPAQDTFYTWAVHMGETGPKLLDSEGRPHPQNDKLKVYEYLNGNFKHIKAVGYKHGVSGKEIKAIIHDFISQPPISKI